MNLTWKKKYSFRGKNSNNKWKRKSMKIVNPKRSFG